MLLRYAFQHIYIYISIADVHLLSCHGCMVERLYIVDDVFSPHDISLTTLLSYDIFLLLWSFDAAFLSIQEACQGGTNIIDVQEYCIDGYKGPSESPLLYGRGVYLPRLLHSFGPTVLGVTVLRLLYNSCVL